MTESLPHARSTPEPEAQSHTRAARRFTRMFGPPPREHGFERLVVEGTIPSELRLTAYFNGPGHFGRGGRRYGHWFDGDGSLAAVRFDGGRAEGAYRTLESRHREIEALARRPVFGAFGTKSAWPLRFVHPNRRVKPAANTSVLCRDGRVYALLEATRPMEIDPVTLESRGLTDFGEPAMINYSAHPVRLADGRVIGSGVRISRRDHVDLFETRDGRTRRIAEVELPFATLMHSFAVAGRYAVLVLPPLCLDKLRYLLSIGTFLENLHWQPERGTQVIVVPLDDPKSARSTTIEPFFFWHVAQAFERAGALEIDLIRYDDAQNATWLGAIPEGARPPIPGGHLHRLSIDPRTLAVRMEQRAEALVEFPVVSPACRAREASLVFCGSDRSGAMSGPVDQLLAVDVVSGTHVEVDVGGDETYPSEPLIVPRGDAPDDAWLLSLVYDPETHRSYVAILDGKRPEAGPVAKAWFDHHVAARFHGDWASLAT